MKRILYTILTAAVVLTGNYLFSNSTLDVKVETPAPTVEIQTLPPAQTQTPVLPSVTNIPANGQALEGPNINFNGIRFTLDPAFGSRVYIFEDTITKPGNENTAHSFHFSLRPEEYEYCVTWCLQIYRVADFEALPDFDFPGGVATIFEAQKKAISFQNGGGDRGLETFGHDWYPVDNERLKYVFRGYSTDKQYGIFIQIPIHAASLPTVAPTMVAGDAGPIIEYNRQAAESMNALTPADFTPNLDLLDALVASISVEAPQ